MFLFSKKCSANLDIHKQTDNNTHTYAYTPCTDHTPSLNIISWVQYTSNNGQSLHKVYKIQTGDEKLAFSILKLKRQRQALLRPSFPTLSTDTLSLVHWLQAGSLSQACIESSPGRNHPWHSGVCLLPIDCQFPRMLSSPSGPDAAQGSFPDLTCIWEHALDMVMQCESFRADQWQQGLCQDVQ